MPQWLHAFWKRKRCGLKSCFRDWTPTFRAWSRKTPTQSPNTWAKTAAPETATECLDLNLQRYIQVMTYLYGHFYLRRRMFWQLIGIHKCCEIGQDSYYISAAKMTPKQCQTTSVPKVPNTSVYCTSEGMSAYTLPVPCTSTFDLSHGLLHLPPSSFWAL